jgi:Ca2+-binding RTX toxin-like protein
MSLTRRAALSGAVVALIGLLSFPQVALAAPRCFGSRATIVGTGGNDRINGTGRRDVIVGVGGHDRINGRGGGDVICGGGGRDLIRGKSGDDELSGGGKRDVLLGQQGNDLVTGAGGADVLLGLPGNDRLQSGPGSDFLVGGSGDDLYAGGGGQFDLISFENSPLGVVVDLNLVTPQNTNEGIDTITGIEGVTGSGFNDTLTGQNVASPTGNGLFGLDGTDQISGLDGDDVIDGGPGSDRGGPGVGFLNGGLGNDLIIGELGDDDLFGEAGNDLLDGFEDGETPTGDFGSGGPDVDECFGLEVLDPNPANACEMNTPREVQARIGGWSSARSAAGGWG